MKKQGAAFLGSSKRRWRGHSMRSLKNQLYNFHFEVLDLDQDLSSQNLM